MFIRSILVELFLACIAPKATIRTHIDSVTIVCWHIDVKIAWSDNLSAIVALAYSFATVWKLEHGSANCVFCLFFGHAVAQQAEHGIPFRKIFWGFFTLVSCFAHSVSESVSSQKRFKTTKSLGCKARRLETNVSPSSHVLNVCSYLAPLNVYTTQQTMDMVCGSLCRETEKKLEPTKPSIGIPIRI